MYHLLARFKKSNFVPPVLYTELEFQVSLRRSIDLIE